MRLIDADRLKELFTFTCTGGGLLGKISNMIIEWACSFVDEMPTIDAVVVVRCKDCKHLFDGEHNANCCAVLMEKAKWLTEITVDPNGYCDEGRKKE